MFNFTSASMTHQLNIFLLLFGALQGVLLSVWFFWNHKRKAAHIYFACFLVVVGLQLTFKVITKAWVMEHALFLYMLSYSFPFLVGPLLFLYVKSVSGKAFVIGDLLHFLPFAFSIINVMLFMQGTVSSPRVTHPYGMAALQVISLAAYGWFGVVSSGKLRSFVTGVIVIEMIIAITLAVMYMNHRTFPDVRLFFIVLTILIYWISYRIISRPGSFMVSDTDGVISLGLIKSTKYAHSSLKPEEATRIEGMIHQLLTHDRLYLDSSLTIDILATRIGTTRHHLSQVFNEKIRKTYAVFLNELRLEEAKRRLCDPVNMRYTIAGIAMDSGFSSVSGFNDLFKKKFGVTPSRFRDTQPDQMTA